MRTPKTLIGPGLLVSLSLLGSCSGGNVDRDGRRDLDDTPGERVCCQVRAVDFFTTRRQCRLEGGYTVPVRRCRRG